MKLRSTGRAAAAAQVEELVLSKDPIVDPCTPSAPATSFLTTDAQVSLFAVILNGRAGDVLEVDWVMPSGQLFLISQFEALPEDGDYCFADYLTIAGDVPANNPGTWTVKGLWNGGSLFSRTFPISRPGESPLPVLSSGGVVNAADYTASFAPGGIISLWGQNLASATASATSAPLPTNLKGTSAEAVYTGRTVAIPLFFVSPGQVNAQLPFDVPIGKIQIQVRTSGGVSNAESITIQARAPKVFTMTGTGAGAAALLHSNFTLVSDTSPAAPGEWVLVYLTGLGEVSPPVAAGQAAGDGVSAPLNKVTETVKVMVNGQEAPVYFAGLAPYFVGLYQVNFQVPEYAAGGQMGVTINAANQKSQDKVTFTCAAGSGWQSVTTVTVGPQGGTLGGAGLTLSVPAGTFSGNNAITVLQNPGRTPEADEANVAFGVSGLPATTSAPIAVSIDLPGPAPDPDHTYLAVSEPDEGAGELFIKATVQGNRVSGTLPPRSKPLSSMTANADKLQAHDTSNPVAGLMILVKLNLDFYESPAGNLQFLFSQKLGIRDKVATLGASVGTSGLDDFMDEVGFGDAWRNMTPVLAYITSSTSGLSSWDPWMGLRYSLRDNWSGAYLRLESSALFLDHSDALDLDPLFITPSLKLIHSLAHAVEAEAVLPTREERAGTGQRPWLWMQEAVAGAMECDYSSAASNYWGLDIADALTFFGTEATGLESPATGGNSDEVAEVVGYGAGRFLAYLAVTNPVRRWAMLGDIYKYKQSQISPVQAIVSALTLQGRNIGDAWLDFWKKAGADQGYKFLRSLTEPWWIDCFATQSSCGDFWNDSQDLSARTYEITFDPKWPSSDKRELKISALGPGKFTLVVFRQIAGGKVEVAGTGPSITFKTPLQDLPNQDGLFWVMVVNQQAVSPFQTRNTVELRLDFGPTATSQTFQELAAAAAQGKLFMDLAVQSSFVCANGKNCIGEWVYIDNMLTGGPAQGDILPVSAGGSSLSFSGKKTGDASSCGGEETASATLNFGLDPATQKATVTSGTATSDCTVTRTTGNTTSVYHRLVKLTILKVLPYQYDSELDSGKAYYIGVLDPSAKDYIKVEYHFTAVDNGVTVIDESGADVMGETSTWAYARFFARK